MEELIFPGLRYKKVKALKDVPESLRRLYFFLPGKDLLASKEIRENNYEILGPLKCHYGNFVDIEDVFRHVTRGQVRYAAPRFRYDPSISYRTAAYDYIWSYVDDGPRNFEYGAFVFFASLEGDCSIIILELSTNDKFAYYKGLKAVSNGFWKYEDCEESGVLYSGIDFDRVNLNPELYNTLEIAEEIRERVKKLRLYGVDECAILALFEPERKLSRLVVTPDYRIFLPDFHDMEIMMEPLPKAVYLLFLNHPEGIYFKDLWEYEAELFNIYKAITRSNDLDDAVEHINRILDPYDNSINEKCSRIKSAFVAMMSDDLAKNYSISGRRAEPKKIILDRALVEMNCDL